MLVSSHELWLGAGYMNHDIT